MTATVLQTSATGAGTRPAVEPNLAFRDLLVHLAPAVAELRQDHTLFVGAIRWALAHGWEPTSCRQEIGISSAVGYQWLIRWDGGTDDDHRRLVRVTEPHPTIGEHTTELRCHSTQQAIDLSAALTGVGTELTTGGREAIRQRGHAKRLHREIMTNPTSGIGSRKRLATVYYNANPSAVCMVDLTGFKQVNDTHGHRMGNLVLREVGQRLDRLHPNHAAHLSGDEYAVLLCRGTDPMKAASQLADTIAEPVTLPDGQIVTVTGAVGVATATGLDFETALHRADIACYCSKAAAQRGPVLWDGQRMDDAMTRPRDGGACAHCGRCER